MLTRFFSWHDALAKLGFRNKRCPRTRRDGYCRRLRIEGLEDRRLLAGITVTNSTDVTNGVTTSVAALIASPGADGISLREAILAANAASDADTIDFDSSLTSLGPASIDLTQGQLSIANNLTIDGPGASQLTIDGQDNSRVFVIGAGKTVTIGELTITGGGGVTYGGGVYTSGDLTLDAVDLIDNAASDFGGGIYVSATGRLDLLQSTVDNNTATYGGGLMGHFGAGERLYIADSTISNNVATGNGAGLIFWANVSGAAGTIVNTTVSGNHAAGSSGGIRVRFAANLIITNSTIAHNTANFGAGIDLVDGPTVTLHNTISANNTTSGGSASNIGGTLQTASSHNLIGLGGSGGLSNGTNGNIVIGAGVNPGLAPLGDYGGATKTHALLVGSVALDAGDDDRALDRNGMPLLFDQRGHARRFDLSDVPNTGNGSVDIGAFEAGNPGDLTVKVLEDELDDIHAPNFDFDDLSLREALAMAAEGAGDYMIHFETLAGEIHLQLGELVVEKEDFWTITIIGPQAMDHLVIDAQGNSRVFRIDAGVSATLRGMRITGGAVDASGAGVYSEGTLTIERCQIDWNTVTGPWHGGGIFQLGGSGTYLTIVDSTIANNTVTGSSGFVSYGGGVWAGLPAIIINSTISNNTAPSGGGGIYAAGSGSQIINSTITANTKGGVRAFDAFLHNSIVAGNSGNPIGGGPWDIIGTFSSSSSNNLIGFDSNLTNGIDDGVNGNYVGGENGSPVIDPLLGPLDYHGGTTQTRVLLPDSPAIDAGDDYYVYAFDLAFDQLGEGFDRILGASVDIGATESHIIIRPSVGIAIFGTQLDDEITVTDNTVTIDRIGTFSVDIASANEVVVDARDGNDSVSAASLSRAVALFGGDGDDTLTGGSGDDTIFGGQGVNAVNAGAGNNNVNSGGNVDFVPGLVDFSAVPPGTLYTLPDGSTVPVNANPFLIDASDGDEWQGSDMYVGWDIFPQNFLLNGSLRVAKLAIVQIVTSTFERDGWFWLDGVEFSDWHVDAPPGFFVYPASAAIWPSSTTQITLNSTLGGFQGILSLGDGPGAKGYGLSPFPFRLLHLKQEFETYIVGLDGPEGIQNDDYESDLFVGRTFKSATVYGGIKWYHEIDFDEQTATYNLVGRQVTDTTGSPTDNLTNALHLYFDYQVVHVPPV